MVSLSRSVPRSALLFAGINLARELPRESARGRVRARVRPTRAAERRELPTLVRFALRRRPAVHSLHVVAGAAPLLPPSLARNLHDRQGQRYPAHTYVAGTARRNARVRGIAILSKGFKCSVFCAEPAFFLLSHSSANPFSAASVRKTSNCILLRAFSAPLAGGGRTLFYPCVLPVRCSAARVCKTCKTVTQTCIQRAAPSTAWMAAPPPSESRHEPSVSSHLFCTCIPSLPCFLPRVRRTVCAAGPLFRLSCCQPPSCSPSHVAVRGARSFARPSTMVITIQHSTFNSTHCELHCPCVRILTTCLARSPVACVSCLNSSDA